MRFMTYIPQLPLLWFTHAEKSKEEFLFFLDGKDFGRTVGGDWLELAADNARY